MVLADSDVLDASVFEPREGVLAGYLALVVQLVHLHKPTQLRKLYVYNIIYVKFTISTLLSLVSSPEDVMNLRVSVAHVHVP